MEDHGKRRLVFNINFVVDRISVRSILWRYAIGAGFWEVNFFQLRYSR